MFKEQLNTTKPNNFETASTRIYYDAAYTYFKGTQEVVKHNSKEHAPNTYIAYIVDKNPIMQSNYGLIKVKGPKIIK